MESSGSNAISDPSSERRGKLEYNPGALGLILPRPLNSCNILRPREDMTRFLVQDGNIESSYIHLPHEKTKSSAIYETNCL